MSETEPNTAAGETRGARAVAEITGERPCVKCGYSLRNQPIEREPHYGLLIARCPECGTPAALQEYPALSRTTTLLRLLLAGLIIAFLLGLAAAHMGLSAGMTAIVQQGSTSGVSIRIAEAWADFEAEERASGRDAYGGQYPTLTRDAQGRLIAYEWLPVSTAWWSQQERAEFRPSIAGWAVHTARTQTAAVLLLGLALVAVGAVWSVVLLPRRLVVAAIAVLPVAVAAGMIYQAVGTTIVRLGAGWVNAAQIAQQLHHGQSALVGAGFAALFTLLGVWQGRRIARGAVRAALPPELRAPLVTLWERDGLEPPRRSVGPSRLHPEARFTPPTNRSTQTEDARDAHDDRPPV